MAKKKAAAPGNWIRINSNSHSNYDCGREGRVVAQDKETNMLVVVFEHDKKTVSVNTTYFLAYGLELDVLPEPEPTIHAIDQQGYALAPYQIRCVYSGASGMAANVTCHIVIDGKSLCGKDARNWSTRYKQFRKQDCKRCAKKVGISG